MRVWSFGALAMTGLLAAAVNVPQPESATLGSLHVESCSGCNIEVVEWEQPTDYDQDFYIYLELTGPAYATATLEAYVGNSSWISMQNPSLSASSVQLDSDGHGSVTAYFHVNSACGSFGCGVAGVQITNAGSPPPKHGVLVQID